MAEDGESEDDRGRECEILKRKCVPDREHKAIEA